MRPVSLPWLKPILTLDEELYQSAEEESGDFVNNRCRIPEKEPLWPENSHLIFYTRGKSVPDDNTFFFYKLRFVSFRYSSGSQEGGL